MKSYFTATIADVLSKTGPVEVDGVKWDAYCVYDFKRGSDGLIEIDSSCFYDLFVHTSNFVVNIERLPTTLENDLIKKFDEIALKAAQNLPPTAWDEVMVED